jgi:predicted RNA-binding protein (virulence factor B family)
MLTAMPFGSVLGRVVTLTIRRFGSPGAFFALDEQSPKTILLPGAEVPAGTQVGDALEVFVYLDSEDRPVATTRTPVLTLGEVAFLTVTDVTPIGAFFDWGMPKELLVPHAEQTRQLAVGDRHPVGLFLDGTGRLAGTMRVSEMLQGASDIHIEQGVWTDGEAWRNEPDLGLFVIVERCFVGLVPATEPHTAQRGDALRVRVANVLPDGKIELSLRGPAHEELAGDASLILAKLSEPGAVRVGDHSSPEAIRDTFGLSKKAFKRAVGRLLKERALTIDADRCLVVARKR